MRKRRWLGVLKATCALLLLCWAFKQVGPDAWSTLLDDRLRLGWVIPGIGLGLLSVVGWAARWFLLLRCFHIVVRFREVLRLTIIGDFFNLYFLGPLGADGIRFALLSRHTPKKRAELAATLILDHIVGMQALVLAFALFAVPQWSWIQEQQETKIALAGTIALVTLGLFGAASGGFFWPFGCRLISATFGLFKRWRFAAKGQELVTQLANKSLYMCTALLMALASLACAYGTFWCAANAIQADITPPRLFALLPISDTFATLPITVSGLGIREQFFLAAFGPDGGAKGAQAVGTSLLGFLFLGIWGIVGGVMLFITQRSQPERESNRAKPVS